MPIAGGAFVKRFFRTRSLAVLVICAVVVVPVAECAAQWTWQSSLEAELEQIRRTGAPTTREELDEFYAPGEEALAAGAAWLAATEFMREEAYQTAAQGVPFVGRDKDEFGRDTRVNVFEWEEGGSLPRLERAERFLATYQTEIDALRDLATSSDRMARPLNWPEHLNMSLDFATSWRPAARLFELQAAVAEERGDARTATEYTGAMLALTRAVQEEPIGISQLVRYAVDGTAGHLTERLLAADLLGDAELSELQQAFSACEYVAHAKAAIVAERAWMLFAIDEIDDPDKPAAANRGLIAGWITSAVKDSGKVEYLRIMSEMVQATDLPPKAAVARLKEIEAGLSDISTIERLTRPGRVIAAMVASSTSSWVKASYRATAHARAGAVGCAVARWKHAEGEWPESLTDVKERFPELNIADPWSDEELIYRPDGPGRLIYSVGPNGADDGAKRYEPRSDDYDHVFRVGPHPSNAESQPPH